MLCMDLEETAAPSTNLSIQLAWLETTNSGKWKPLFDLKLANYGRDFTFCYKLNVVDTKEVVKVMAPFLNNNIEILGRNKLCESSQLSNRDSRTGIMVQLF